MSDYHMNQQHQWGTPQFSQSQHIQLEEEYYNPGQRNGHHQYHAPVHTASYPPVSNQQANRLSPHHAGQRSQSFGGANYAYGTGGAFVPSMGQPGQNSSQQAAGSAGRFLAQPSYRPPYPQVTTSSPHGTPNLDNGVSKVESGPSPTFTTSPMSTPLMYDSQSLPSQGQGHYQQQPVHMYHDGTQSAMAGSLVQESQQAPQQKRPRMPDEEEEPILMDIDDDDDVKDSKDLRSKLGGACARCKRLKVKCEFTDVTNSCKRCAASDKQCWIPGRKPRRAPPKREHLLAEIREKAAKIEELMAKLEATKKPPRVNTSARITSPNADLLSPLDGTSPTSATSKPDVEEWIAKARESIEIFGGLIGASGAGMTKDFLVDGDPEDSGSADDEVYEYLLEDEEGEMVEIGEHDGSDTSARQRRSASRDLENVGPGPKSTTGTAEPKLASLPAGTSPIGMIANLALKHRKRTGSPGIGEEEDVGVANDEYFKPERTVDPETIRTPTEAKQAPHILARGVITPDEAEKLFRIYFDNMNLSCSLLDPVLYTAQKTCYRSPFLFTVICAIASRFYLEKPNLYRDLMHYAQLAAGTALISGHKSVEVCQAYILLSLYPVPARKWEDHRSWLYLGLAIRVASDLNLHFPNTAKPLNEQHAREMLNRTRVWMNCFNLDRSTGSQYGKPPIIPNSDYVANHSEKWWKSSEFNLKNFDIQLCGYNAELKVMAKFTARIYSDPNHPTGLNKKANFEKIAFETDDELKTLGQHWFTLLDQTDQTDTQNRFRTGLLKIAYSYARLVALALAFQHTFGKVGTNVAALIERSLSAAFDIANTYVNDVGRPAQRIYIRHGPEAQSVFATFAASFLVKLLHNKYSAHISPERRLEIRSLVQSVADLLGSREIAIDDRHSPKLYSRFLIGLLATPMANADPASPASTVVSSASQRRLATKGGSGSCLTPESEQSFELISNHTSSPISPSSSNFANETNPAMHFVPATPPSFSPYNGSPSQGAKDLTLNDWFPTPLSFDAELVRSMQSVQDSVWGQDMTVPGFNWLNNMQPTTHDFTMPPNDSGNVFHENYFVVPTPSP